MISKFDGICCFCKERTIAGKDDYDLASKISYHAECREKAESTPSREQFELAERLGFIEWSPSMGSDGLLLRMSRRPGKPSAGRISTETFKGQGSIW